MFVLLLVVAGWVYLGENTEVRPVVYSDVRCGLLAEARRIEEGRPVVCDSSGQVIRHDR